MSIMNITWPITGLYMPLVGWWAYRRMGRARQPGRIRTGRIMVTTTRDTITVATSPSGRASSSPRPTAAAATLGDVVTAPIATATGFALLGSTVLGHFALAFVGAYLFGVLFQYLPIRAMSDAGPAQALKDAIKADTLSLVAFQLGMYAWMLIALQGWMGELDAFTAPFWFMMQIAMLIGFATSYPANWILINRGIKHGM
ncbi:DUF4396 domain-containing protein [Salinicola tamaricis]|uniref:DUF4396 domain-containing protein n=1 Tax=Salinicola tamaricis TaxID=1771309 RepID=UPI001F5CA06A|nr:DUF4396 domain-containing protein [Salinicola tamaricis]